MNLVKHNRYAFYINGKKHIGIFVGYEDDGKAVMITKSGYVWTVPAENFIKKEGKNHE
jgi:hypothetical protein